MNERTQALATQAKQSVPQGILAVDKWIETYNKEFARLIVLECAEIADTAEPFLASDLIKEHFGVE